MLRASYAPAHAAFIKHTHAQKKDKSGPRTLPDKLSFEFVQELERELVFWRERLLAHDRLHRRRITADGVLGVLKDHINISSISFDDTHQLVRDITMILPRQFLTNSTLHQPR